MQDAPDARTSARVAQRQASSSAATPTTASWSAEAEIELRRKAKADRERRVLEGSLAGSRGVTAPLFHLVITRDSDHANAPRGVPRLD